MQCARTIQESGCALLLPLGASELKAASHRRFGRLQSLDALTYARSGRPLRRYWNNCATGLWHNNNNSPRSCRLGSSAATGVAQPLSAAMRLLKWPLDQLPLSCDALVLNTDELQQLLDGGTRMAAALKSDLRWIL